ncbi:MAG: TIGR00730 family Rossman fold protein [Myxococcota bacterium]
MAVSKQQERPVLKRLCVFCGSNRGTLPEYTSAVRSLGREMADRQIGLVFGGGGVGLMGEIADAVLDAGGQVVGVLPHSLGSKEIAHPDVEDIRIVGSMHERKALMSELSDGFIAAPGGYGTLEELFEQLTWGQLGIHRKPCGLLNVAHYFDPLLAFLDSSAQQKFIRPQHRETLLAADTAEDLIAQLETYQPPQVDKWLDFEPRDSNRT